MPESAEAVRKSFDELEYDLGREVSRCEQANLPESSLLTGTRYQVSALREIAVQIARIADVIEGRAGAMIEALERSLD